MIIYQVDAFTEIPFAGNPAAVCVLTLGKDEAWMQAVAREMNLSETAFLVPQDDGFNLRWFTPTAEVDLCGHATLASAHILWERGYLPPEKEVKFYTKSGVLLVRLQQGWLEMDFPATPAEAAVPPAELLRALQVEPLYVGKNIFDYIVEVKGEETVKKVKPDFALLRTVAMRGVIVTARGRDHDFISRFFAPAVGIDEDPVTGSTHSCLGPYWEKRLGKDIFTAYQASERGGELRVKNTGSRVLILGKAVTVLKGELLY